MSEHDDTAVTAERLDALADGVAPRDADERELAALMRELRAGADDPSDALRARVGEIATRETAPSWSARLRDALAGLRLTPPRLAAAAGVVAAALLIAVSLPVLTSGGSEGETLPAVAPDGRAQAESGATDEALAEPDLEAIAPPAVPGERPAGPAAPGALPPVAPGGRPQEIVARSRISVDGVEALSAATARAMAIARSLGGFTERSDFRVPNGELGTSELVLRVPSGRAGVALERVAALGTILSQDADLRDLSQRLARGRAELGRGAAEVARLRREAAADPNDAGLARRLARAEARQRELVRAQRAVRRRATLATLNLTLTTEGPVDPPPGGLGGSLSTSGERLGAIAVALLGGLILLAPFAVIAALAGLGVRWAIRRRRAGLWSRP